MLVTLNGASLAPSLLDCFRQAWFVSCLAHMMCASTLGCGAEKMHNIFLLSDYIGILKWLGGNFSSRNGKVALPQWLFTFLLACKLFFEVHNTEHLMKQRSEISMSTSEVFVLLFAPGLHIQLTVADEIYHLYDRHLFILNSFRL